MIEKNTLKDLIQEIKKPDAKSYCAPAYLQASAAGNIEALKILLDGGVDINSRATLGYTIVTSKPDSNGKIVSKTRFALTAVTWDALYAAGMFRKYDAVSYLLDRGIDTREVLKNFHFEDDSEEFATFVVNHVKLQKSKDALLFATIEEGYFDLAKTLIKNGANPNALDPIVSSDESQSQPIFSVANLYAYERNEDETQKNDFFKYLLLDSNMKRN